MLPRHDRTHAPALLLWSLLALALCPSSPAQVAQVEDLTERVRPGSKTTYLDLLLKVFPGLRAPDGTMPGAGRSVPLSHLFGDYRGVVFEGLLPVHRVERLWIRSGGRRRLLLLAHVGAPDVGEARDLAVLALFALEPDARLLDAKDVQSDRFAGFWDAQPRVRLAPGDEAVVIANSHHNSSQNYLGLTLVAPDRDRLRILYDLPTLLDLNDCDGRLTQTARLTPLRRPARTRPDILVQVRVRKTAPDPACDPPRRARPYVRHYRARLVWNDAERKYAARGDALTRLSRFNEQNY